MEMESRMLAVGEGNGQLSFNGYRISVLQMKRVMDLGSCVGCTIM